LLDVAEIGPRSTQGWSSTHSCQPIRSFRHGRSHAIIESGVTTGISLRGDAHADMASTASPAISFNNLIY
jgi:hypothetical protein